MQYSDRDMKLHRCFIKSYKKHTAAIFLSFVLTFLLLGAMLSLLHTNFRISNIQAKTEFTPSDCYVKDLSWQQAVQLQEDEEIEKTALQQGEYEIFVRNEQQVFLNRNDTAAMTMVSKLTEGRFPEEENEVAAEKWVLLNLGIEPVPGQRFEVRHEDSGETESFCLTGILSDAYGNKKYGLLNFYAPMEEDTDDLYVAYLEFRENVNYEEKVEQLQEDLGVEKKQIRESPVREDSQGLFLTDVQIISVILMICMVVFYGVYRIAVQSRMQQYGILRAVGMKRRQLQRMLLTELYQIYLIGAPVGIAAGIFTAWVVMLLSGDRDTEVFLYNETVRFELVIPLPQILICAVLALLMVTAAGYLEGRRITAFSIIETISGNREKQREERIFFDIQRADSKAGTLFQMACKYIFRDLRTSGFAILTICLGILLFTGLIYKAEMLKQYRTDTKEMYYLNGQYAMTMRYFDHTDQGVSRDSLQELEAMEQITAIRTSSGLPVRVVDDGSIRRNDAYYETHNENLQKYYGYCDAGYDGTDQVYKSILYGYNEEALEALEPYVVEGEFQAGSLQEEEVILCMLRSNGKEEENTVGWYKDGTPLMEYQVGDEITVKYPADFQTNTLEYEMFTDDCEYIRKTFRISAIVSFPYMYDSNRTVYPLLITSDGAIRKIAPESGIQCIYLDGEEGMDEAEQGALEQRLIQAGSRNSNVSTRSLIEEIRQNEMFYRKQMVYIYGISIIVFLLVMVYLLNNLKYRMQARTREISMLRAVGLSVGMARRMMIFENLILGVTAVASAFVISQPVLRYLYQRSEMQAFEHEFSFDYPAFLGVSLAALAICVLLSSAILKEWRTPRIVEGMGRFE